MTNILLSIIAVLLFARIVMQIKQGKRAVEKGYAAPSEVENIEITVDSYRVGTTISDYGKRGYELVQAICPYGSYGDSKTQLFFTRKKIKNYYEE